jgi:hypothetical protein
MFTVLSLPSEITAAIGVVDFLSKHLLVAAILISAGWFFAGYQYFAKGDRSTGIQWQIIAVLILIAFCINVILSGRQVRLNLIVAVLAITGEIWLMCRIYVGKRGEKDSLD